MAKKMKPLKPNRPTRKSMGGSSRKISIYRRRPMIALPKWLS